MTEPTIWAKLAAPLDPRVIKTREQAGKTLRYIDSRTVDDILDAHAPGEWNVTMQYLGSREVVGRNGEALGQAFAIKASLTVYGVTREDVGEGKDYKAAASDALKRAAVRFGIGRELYGFLPNGASQGLPAASAGAAPPSATGKSTATAAPAPAPRRAPPRDPFGRAESAEEGRAAELAARAEVATGLSDIPACPKCGGKCWDNRLSKRNPKAPDFKCRDRSCDGVIWPPKKGEAPRAAAKPSDETDEEYWDRMKREMDGEELIPF